MRFMELKLVITCLPSELEDDSICCDDFRGCDDCFKKTFKILEKQSNDIQNFKIEHFDITRIIDFKKRRWNEIGKRKESQ